MLGGAGKAGKAGKAGGAGSDPFSTGIMHGMSLGGGSVKGAYTKGLDQQLGMSALQQYKDMSESRQDYGGMNEAMQFSQSQKPGGPYTQLPQAVPNNAYVQALLQAMRGVR